MSATPRSKYIIQRKDEGYWWILRSARGEHVATSLTYYKTMTSARRGAERFAKQAATTRFEVI